MWIGKGTVWAHNFYYHSGYLEGPNMYRFLIYKKKSMTIGSTFTIIIGNKGILGNTIIYSTNYGEIKPVGFLPYLKRRV